MKNKIALGTPESVPAGKYAKASLTHENLWNDVQNKVVFTKDVRQVLTYVETGMSMLVSYTKQMLSFR